MHKRGMTVQLMGRLDGTAALDLKGKLVEKIAAAQPCLLDAALIDSITTPALQVLLAAKQQCTKFNIPFALENPSKACLEGIQDLGLGQMFFSTQPTESL
jgi:anti-anti-sigma regulatory factor